MDVLRSATSVNADLLNQSGALGVVEVGAHADLVVFDGDPLASLACMYEGGPYTVIKAGTIVASR